MATQGPNYPAIGDSYYLFGIPVQIPWDNPGNITADDGSYASSSLTPDTTRVTERLRGTGFGFDIPDDAQISGISVDMEKYASNAISGQRVIDNTVRLLLPDGTESSEDKGESSNWPTSPGISTYGGSGDLWGETWTPADINSANFGLSMAASLVVPAGGVTAYVGSMEITVYYTIPTATLSNIQSITNVQSITL